MHPPHTHTLTLPPRSAGTTHIHRARYIFRTQAKFALTRESPTAFLGELPGTTHTHERARTRARTHARSHAHTHARSHTPTHLDRVTASPKIGTTVDSRPPAATRRENVVSNIRSISCWFADQSSDQSHAAALLLIFQFWTPLSELTAVNRQ